MLAHSPLADPVGCALGRIPTGTLVPKGPNIMRDNAEQDAAKGGGPL